MTLCPGGMAFGVKFTSKGLLVVGLSDVKADGKTRNPAREAGLKVRDILLTADGEELSELSDFTKRVEQSGGSGIRLTLMRDGERQQTTLYPILSDGDGRYKAGLWLRDGSAGIGTVTFIDPETGEFGGLGHGICDAETGSLIPLRKGTAMKVEIGGVVKGKSGRPGEIKGYFLPEKSGGVFSNTVCGVFGIFTEKPSDTPAPLPIGLREEIREGKAELICTLGGDGAIRYEIELSEIDRGGTDNKNFVVRVTDKRLLERTGGIVQGMSGSPIIQNGKLVGAVTHVMVSDPAVGYGILIENMLDAMAEQGIAP